MSSTVITVLKALILPPGIFLVVFLVSFLFFYKKQKIFICLCVTSIVFLYVFSTPVFSRYLSTIVEPEHAIDTDQLHNNSAKAIVILGCSRYSNAPEFDGMDTISACALVRLRYAVILHKAIDLPIMVSGGSVNGETVAEAEIMQEVLRKEFGVSARWIENKSHNTYENAQQTARLLDTSGIDQVILVTHAIHMLRAVDAFDKFGIKVLPAPTNFYSVNNDLSYLDFLPSIEALHISNMVLYEIAGYLWFHYRYPQ